MNLAQIGSFWFGWFSPVVLVLYAIGTRTPCEPGGSRTPARREAEAVTA